MLCYSVDFSDYSAQVKNEEAKMGKAAYNGDTFLDRRNVLYLLRIDFKLACFFKIFRLFLILSKLFVHCLTWFRRSIIAYSGLQSSSRPAWCSPWVVIALFVTLFSPRRPNIGSKRTWKKLWTKVYFFTSSVKWEFSEEILSNRQDHDDFRASTGGGVPLAGAKVESHFARLR